MADDLKTNWIWQTNEMDVNLIILQSGVVEKTKSTWKFN
jgi:hypothetical protein